MVRRLPIVALLLLTYAFLLGHDLLPHHHHDGHSHHHPAAGHSHEHPAPDDTDHDSGWFVHSHALGSFACEPNAPTEIRTKAPVAALPTRLWELLRVVDLEREVIAWPSTRPKAPPGFEPYRPLRAPPISFPSLG